jgi:hypothetical protein
MRRALPKQLAIAIQILALFMVQFNALTPQFARLFPAIAAGDLGECHCTIECRCSLKNRQNGTCCCKQMKKLKLKMHCKPDPRKQGTVSLRSCPCGGSSHITLMSTEYQTFLPATLYPVSHAPLPESLRSQDVEGKLCDRLPEPPDPPPRDSFSDGTKQQAAMFS